MAALENIGSVIGNIDDIEKGKIVKVLLNNANLSKNRHQNVNVSTEFQALI